VNLFDSSAPLAYLRAEPGRDRVREQLVEGGRVSAANWAEVAAKSQTVGPSLLQARALILSWGLSVEPVLELDAELAARLWRRGSGLSLGDRLCLATAERLDATVCTADSAWGTSGRIRQIR